MVVSTAQTVAGAGAWIDIEVPVEEVVMMNIETTVGHGVGLLQIQDLDTYRGVLLGRDPHQSLHLDHAVVVIRQTECQIKLFLLYIKILCFPST